MANLPVVMTPWERHFLHDFYLVCASTQRSAERFLRQTDGGWLYAEAAGQDESLELPSIGVTLALHEV